jgi:glutathione synthase
VRVLILVNDVSDLSPRMTTTHLCAASARLGEETFVVELGGLGIGLAGETLGVARRWPSGSELDALCRQTPEQLAVEASDVFLVRLNPARYGSPQHVAFTCWMLRRLERAGCRVINSADALELTATKAFLSDLPEDLRPRQAVVANLQAADAALRQLGPHVVVKPVRGSRGADVLFLEPGTDSGSVIAPLLRQGPVVVQEKLVAESVSDVRVLMVSGQPFLLDDQIVAVRRTAAPGELRANLHLGGRAEVAELDESSRCTLRELSPHLQRAGVQVAGVDLMNGKVLELNVWAPGGVGPFQLLTGKDLATPLLRALLAS